MAHDILIHIHEDRIKAALIENEQVAAIDMSPLKTDLALGDIYYAKVVRVLSALKMAFIELGRSRTAILHFSDIKEAEDGEAGRELKVGQWVLVQVSKLPTGDKGAVVSMHIQLVGMTVIYEPFKKEMKISKQIEDEQERERLWTILRGDGLSAGGMVRSLAADMPASEILKEWEFLCQEWDEICETSQGLKKTTRVKAGLSWECAFIRDHISLDTRDIYVDNLEYYQQIVDFFSKTVPSYVSKVKRVSPSRSPWKTYKIDKIIKSLLSPRVELPSGGYLLIERTQAMTAVDVNTGSCVQGKNNRDAIFQTNIEAAKMLGRQLRLRNLSGMVVIDFIRMKNQEQQAFVKATLDETLSEDTVYCKTYGFSPLGLIELTRQRKTNSWVDEYK